MGFVGVFISSIIVSRVLGVEGRGIYSLFMATATGLWIVATLGMAQGHLYHASKDHRWLSHFMANGLAFSVVIGGIVGVAYFLGGRALGVEAVSLFSWPVLLAGIVAVPIGVLLTYQKQYFMVLQRYELAKLSGTISLTVLPLLGYLGLYLVGHAGVGSFVCVFLAAQLVSFAAFHMVGRRFGMSLRGFSLDLARRSWSFGFRQFASDIALYLTGRLDFFLVMLFLGAKELGIYSVAVGLAEITGRLSNEIGTMLFPIFAAGSLKAGQPAAVLRLVTLFAVSVATILGLTSDPLVRILFGQAFAEAIPALRWLLLGAVAWSTTYVTWPYISAAGRPGVGVFVFGVSAAVDVVLNILLLPQWGVIGASIAATVSYFVAALIFLQFFRRSERYSLRELLVATPSDVIGLWRAGRRAVGTAGGQASSQRGPIYSQHQ